MKDFTRDLFVNRLASSPFIPKKARKMIYKLYGMDIIGNVLPGCSFWSSNFRIGEGSFVNRDCYFMNHDLAGVIIGKNCAVAPKVTFSCISHEIGNEENRAGKHVTSSIEIKDGCWIGTGVIINPGIVIEKGCIIASGSVVTKNCSANGLYAGIPAKRIKNLDEIHSPAVILSNKK